jgi:hypothetical protein
MVPRTSLFEVAASQSGGCASRPMSRPVEDGIPCSANLAFWAGKPRTLRGKPSWPRSSGRSAANRGASSPRTILMPFCRRRSCPRLATLVRPGVFGAPPQDVPGALGAALARLHQGHAEREGHCGAFSRRSAPHWHPAPSRACARTPMGGDRMITTSSAHGAPNGPPRRAPPPELSSELGSGAGRFCRPAARVLWCANIRSYDP